MEKYAEPLLQSEKAVIAVFGGPFKQGMSLIRHHEGEVQTPGISRVWGGIVYDVYGRALVSLSDMKGFVLYNASNMLLAMQERKAYHEAKEIELWEQYVEDFPTEAHRVAIHEGANAQVEYGQKYAVKSIYQPETVQTVVG